MPRVELDDTFLHYDEAGEGDQAIVFLHGWISSRRNWVETIPRLPLDRLRAYAFDFRGAGESGRPDAGLDPERFADDIAAAMRALGVARFHVVGHSLGGLVGELLALNHPDRVDRLVLVAPAASGGLPAPALMEMVGRASRDPVRFRAVCELDRARPLSERLSAIQAEDAHACSEEHVVKVLSAMRDLDLRARLPSITAPTLMVVGDRDGLRPYNLDDAARIPNCALQVFYRVGHWIPWDVPQAFADLLVDFLDHGPAPALDVPLMAAKLQALVDGL